MNNFNRKEYSLHRCRFVYIVNQTIFRLWDDRLGSPSFCVLKAKRSTENRLVFSFVSS